MSKTHIERVVKNATKKMSKQYHPRCNSTTEINSHVIRVAVLDPWHFAFQSSECSGCGDVALSEVKIKDGRTLQQTFKDMQSAVPLSGKVFRFLGIPLIMSIIGGAFGPLLKFAGDSNYSDGTATTGVLIMIGAGGGLLLGLGLMGHLFSMVRGWGLFWDASADKQVWTTNSKE